ncbi:capsular biosynthesis protein CpsH [Cellulophaga sp. E16_2]|uniref:hypothetical protein n=1 Tax=Cellulophaga sp. E16_2 TaxID=2789297 RepID=UPI001A90E631|nr:hypothetical protein [Cellulophaga sp. E16_2]MBO0591353.1 capsular biosynthesis protein CpsH [Cellulophaga sp. E16_2]
MFKDKKILFFSANFFGYQTEIKNSLIKLEAHVDFYDERPKNNFWTKAFIRLDKRIIRRKIEKYYQGIIDEKRQIDYDYVFFLKAEAITIKMLNEFRKKQPKAKFILFMWDSIKNSSKDIEQLIPLFDKILSFDREDSEKYPFIIFRPLFYLEDYSLLGNTNSKIEYDISFIGTGHTDRYTLVSQVKDFCVSNGLKGFFFLYLQDIKVYLIRKLFKKAYRNAHRSDFNFKSLNKDGVLDIIKHSNCVLDIQRSVQSGLTMRTLEVLGAKKKLITTNKDIVNYDFYDKNNIFVIDRDNITFPLEFIKGKYHDIDSSIYEKYSINSWLREVFK